VVLIAFDELDAQRACECCADQALAGSGDAHQDVKASVHQLQVVGSCRLSISDSGKSG
jgi:hypothetical protein